MLEAVEVTGSCMWEIDKDRLAEAMRLANRNQSEVAEAVGLRQPSIGRLLSGDTKASRAIEEIADFLGTTTDYLRGKTDDPSPAHKSEIKGHSVSVPETPPNSVMIPQLEIGYSMGGGSVFSDYQQTDMVPFPREWLRPMIGGTFADLFVARGEGDSMMPTLLDGDLCIVDTAQQTIKQQDRLWCLSYGELGMIKRVRMQPDGGALVISDNPAVQSFTAYDQEVHTIGRVIWIGRRV